MKNKIYKIEFPSSKDEDLIIDDTIDTDNISNIIQILCYNRTLYILSSDGKVYFYDHHRINILSGLTNIIYMTDASEYQFTNANGRTFKIDNQKILESKFHDITDIQGDFILKDRNVFHKDDLADIVLPDVAAISAGYNHYLALSYDGRVCSWGKNYYGQLGNGSQEDDYALTIIPDFNNVIQVLACKEMSLFLMKNGDVYHCGRNLEDIVLFPTKMSGVENVVELLNMKNYPYIPMDKDVEQLAYFDKEYYNFQIARTKDDQFLVLIGELLYPIKLF